MPLPGPGQAMLVPVSVRNSVLLIPASGFCQRLPLPGSGQEMMVPVPFKKDIILLPTTGFLPDIVNSWSRSGNVGSCSCQVQRLLPSGLWFLSEIGHFLVLVEQC